MLGKSAIGDITWLCLQHCFCFTECVTSETSGWHININNVSIGNIERFNSRGQHLSSMQIYWNKRKRFLIHKKRVQLPHDLIGTPTWPLFHYPGSRGPFSKYLIWNKPCLRFDKASSALRASLTQLRRDPSASIRKKYPLEPRVLFHCFGTQIWPPWRHVKTLFKGILVNYVYIRTWIGRKSKKKVFSRVTLHDLKRENMIQTKKMCYFFIFMLYSVFRVCNFFECIISFTGSYTEALNDAKMAVELQPSFLKAFVRGRLTLHIPFDNIFFLKKISRCVNIWKLSLH